MDVLVISQEDSRPSIVDLARTLGDMTKQGKLYPEDVTIDLIDENLTGFHTSQPHISYHRKLNDGPRFTHSVFSQGRTSRIPALANQFDRDIVPPSDEIDLLIL